MQDVRDTQRMQKFSIQPTDSFQNDGSVGRSERDEVHEQERGLGIRELLPFGGRLRARGKIVGLFGK